MLPIPLRRDFSLRDFNTFGVDARALAYLPVTGEDVLAAVQRDESLRALPKLVLGGGSNLLLTRDYPGLVLHMRNRGIEIAGEDADCIYVRAAAGENWHGLVEWTLAQGLGGLENLALIPGSVGASPIQNIGAYGVELKNRFHSLRAWDFVAGETITLDAAACAFAYRDSIFKQALCNRVAVLDVTFALPRRWQADTRYADVARALEQGGVTNPTARQIADAVIAIRRRKLPDPTVIGNAGSFFKNPLVTPERHAELAAFWPGLVAYAQDDGAFKLAAGWLIDQCGWKGKRLGAAGVYDRQALVLVNLGGATGQEIAELARAIQRDVLDKFGVTLEPEPVFV